MRLFQVVSWDPSSDPATSSRETDSFYEALFFAQKMRTERAQPEDDARVTIHFNQSGRWLEWWFNATTNGWEFDESIEG